MSQVRLKNIVLLIFEKNLRLETKSKIREFKKKMFCVTLEKKSKFLRNLRLKNT